ncbi:carbonic anhydrase [Candidatus Pelagibacter sp.]|nr:carbonic anhydrase [Candidatus Pelagibacter sp.]
MNTKIEAMVLSCMDPRFQSSVNKFLKQKKLASKYSSFTIAGAAVGVTHNKYKEWYKTFTDNLAASIMLHNINKLIIINHEDCGAIKLAEGKIISDELKIHKISFKKLKTKLSKKFPKLKLEFFIMKLDKKCSKISIK